MAEAFVKTFKRDYMRASPIPDAAAALGLIDRRMEDYNTVHPHPRLGHQSPREYILSQPVACPFNGVNSKDADRAKAPAEAEGCLVIRVSDDD
jgi:integrase-like protein